MIKTVRQYIEELLLNELVSLGISDKEINELTMKQLNRFIGLFNSVLLELHTNFNIITKSVYIETIEDMTDYIIDAKYSINNIGTSQYKKYIIDTPKNPFKNDLIKILAVYDEFGCRLPINNINHPFSIFIPKYNVIQFTFNSDAGTRNTSYEVIFQANHSKLHKAAILKDDNDLLYENTLETLEQEIYVPIPLEQAFKFKVASAYYIGLSGEGFSAKSKEFLIEYSIICAEVKNNNSVEYKVVPSNTALDRNRFP